MSEVAPKQSVHQRAGALTGGGLPRDLGALLSRSVHRAGKAPSEEGRVTYITHVGRTQSRAPLDTFFFRQRKTFELLTANFKGKGGELLLGRVDAVGE